MNGEPLRVAIVIGSTRTGRRAPVVANWFRSQVDLREDMTHDVIDLLDFALPGQLGDPPTEGLAELSRRLSSADAYVIVVPEYNHSFPAPLKNALDWNSGEWKGKPVGFVSYGGRSGGLRAVEQLRQVFPEMHAMTIRDNVSFHEIWAEFDASGLPRDAGGASRAAQAMLGQLAWWGTALRQARLTAALP